MADERGMSMKYLVYLLAILTLVIGCDNKQPSAETIPAQEEFSTIQPVDPLKSQVGEQLTIVGQFRNMKAGPSVLTETNLIYLDVSNEVYNLIMSHDHTQKMKVTGKLDIKHDLPVFIHDPDSKMEDLVSGIPVPPGTDLHEASKRYVLENVTWEFVVPAK